VRRRLVLLLPLSLLALGSAGAAGPAAGPTAGASALAIQILVPGAPGAQTQTVVSPPNGAPVLGGAFAYPADASVASAASTTASATTTVAGNAGAVAESDVSALSVFGGELTADAVTARASAGTGPSGAGGNQNRSAVSNLRFDGQPVTGNELPLGDWGRLTLGVVAIDRSAPEGTRGYRGAVTELAVHLTADHAGLPAGSELRIGYAEAAVQTAPPPTSTTVTVPVPAAVPILPTGPRHNHAPAPKRKQGGRHPLRAHPKLGATGGYVFPVYGPVSYGDTFGAPRADVTYHHGDDIFGRLGQPLLACVSGTVFSVGWNKVGGNRLWIVDDQGNQFYYAHLSAFSTAVTNGTRVKAGQVVGFMGDTGDAEGTPYHLHFEIHSVKYLYLGYDGAVDPTRYLDSWKHLQTLPFPIPGGWVPPIRGGHSPPEPGAILLGMRDISSANGLDPRSLARALAPAATSSLMQTLVPTLLPTVAPATAPPAPPHDLGRG
jgi:murein DD-endopeptidase MepM/ murein hydrolase activator NlpD